MTDKDAGVAEGSQMVSSGAQHPLSRGVEEDMTTNDKPRIMEIKGKELAHPKPEMTYRIIIHDEKNDQLNVHAQGAVIGDLYQQYVSSHEARLQVNRERLQEYADVFSALAARMPAEG